MFAVKRYERGSTLVALTASSSKPAHAQGYFTATILVVVTLDGFTLSPCYKTMRAYRLDWLATTVSPCYWASVSDMKSHGEISSSNHIPP